MSSSADAVLIRDDSPYEDEGMTHEERAAEDAKMQHLAELVVALFPYTKDEAFMKMVRESRAQTP